VSTLQEKPLEHRTPSIIPATNEAQFKFPKNEKNNYCHLFQNNFISLPLSFGTEINLLTRHSRSIR
jgi:hypothetical protein